MFGHVLSGFQNAVIGMLSSGNDGTMREWLGLQCCGLDVVVEHPWFYLCAKFQWSRATALEIMAVAGFLHFRITTFIMISGEMRA